MMKCKDAGPLLEKEEFEKLPLMKRVSLKFHLAMCKICNGYKKESGHLNELIKTADSSKSSGGLSHEEKADIKENLVQ